MEPRIQYAKTSDGVSIAYSTLGEGLPLVQMPQPFSHLQLDWEVPDFRSFSERLGENRKHVRYDSRGTGLSDRDVADLSVDAGVRDLEAVVDRLGLERFAIHASVSSGLAGIAYAVSHPGQVTHLILWHSYARFEDYASGPQVQSLTQMADADWEMYTETLAHVGLGWSAGEEARRYAAIVRESVTQAGFQALLAAYQEFDVTELLPQVESPTLVLHRRQSVAPPLDTARDLASHIPNARLVLLEGAGGAPYVGDVEAVHRAIEEFLGEGGEASAASQAPEPSAFRTVLFTDIEGSTSLTQRLGDAAAQSVLRSHNSIVRDSLAANSGTEIKHTGDGIMASFTSASAALEAAVAIQKALADHNEDNPDTAIRVRIGLNAGEPVAEDEDLFGTAVQLAARVCDKAEPGQILASNVVQELAAGKGFDFADQGEASLKGFENPVRLHEVRWHD